MKDIYKVAISFLAAAVLVALAGAVSLATFRAIESTTEDRIVTANLIIGAENLLGKITDAERGERGFALTGREEFLQSYFKARDTLPGELKAFRELTASRSSVRHVDAMLPLMESKLQEMARIVELRRRHDTRSVLALTSGPGRNLVDAIRAETSDFIEMEQATRATQHAIYEADMKRMFVIIMIICAIALFLPLSFSYQVYQASQRRLKDVVHIETQRLLEVQEDVNKQLQLANTILHVSEEKLSVTLNSIDDAVIATDAEGRVTLLNPLAERLTGWARADAIGLPVEQVFQVINGDTRQPNLIPIRETLATGSTLSLAEHTIMMARDGTECDIADSCAPILNRDGMVVGAVLVFRDVTERKRLDKALQDKNAELEIARSVADKANLAKSHFLSSMSHELRTPLSAILGFAQLMESGSPPPTPAQKRSIEQVLKAGWYLLDLINEILDLAMIESGKLSLSMEPMELADVIRECQVMIEPQAHKSGISVEFASFESQYLVNADRTRVKQIVLNLLSNAIKYNSPNGTVLVDYVLTTPDQIRISVRDSGAGLSSEKIEQLFQPFNRLGQAEGSEEGTGIGLVMCKRLTEVMGGTIGVESTVGKGSVFWIELNLAAQPKILPVAEQDTKIVPPLPVAATQMRTLLYVEDNPANLLLVEELMARRPNIQLLSEREGLAGVRTAIARRPDVILMDIHLPGISGTGAMRMLAQNPITTSIPIVALSANAMASDIEKGLEAGFFRYLTKPIKVKEFMDTLDLAFDQAEIQSAQNPKGKDI